MTVIAARGTVVTKPRAKRRAAPRAMWRSIENLPRRGLVAVVAFAMIGTVALLAYSAIAISTTAVTAQVNHRLITSATVSASYVSRQFHEATSVVESVAIRPSLMSAISTAPSYDLERLDVQIRDLAFLIPEAVFTAVEDPAGTMIDTYPRDASIGKNFAYRDYYIGAKATGRPYVSDAYVSTFAGAPLVVAVAAPIRATAVDPIVGYLIVTYSLDTIQAYTNSFGQIEGVNLIVTDHRGTLVASRQLKPGSLTLIGSDPRVIAALAGNANVTEVGTGNNRLLSAYAPVPNLGWTLLADIPTATAYADVTRLTTTVLLISGFMALVVAITLAMLNANLRRRVQLEADYRNLNQNLELRVVDRTAELEASNRELEAFTYSVSHDLRAPLRAMAGFSALLERKYLTTLTGDGAKYITRISQNAEQMGRLIDELLRFSRLSRQDLKLQRVRPKVVVDSVLNEIGPTVESGNLSIKVESMPDCMADPALLRHVYTNLISNAIKFTSKRPVATIVVGAATDGPQTVFYVKDDGAGFDMRYASKLFGVFQRLHNREQFDGTGVGLAIVHRIITRHNGRVWAESKEGAGATFYFTLGGNGDGIHAAD